MKGKKRQMALRLEDHVCFALHTASRAFTRAYAPLLAPLGLTYPQYLVMVVLWETDDQSVGDLGARLALDSGTLTPLLKRLEEAGFVERRRATEDERVVRARLTTSGRGLRERAADVPLDLACRAGFQGESDMGELARLRDALHALTQRLEAAARAPIPVAKQRAKPTR